MKILLDLIQHLCKTNQEQIRKSKNRLIGGGEFVRGVFDEDAELTRGENDLAGAFNWRTGRFDNGTDMFGDYDNDDLQ